MNLQALSLGLYIHVPFCANACDYCHFFKLRPSKTKVRSFLEKLRQEKNFWQNELLNRLLETIFWGGGSPSCLMEDELNEVGQLCLSFGHPKEWTVEVSPVSITKDKLIILKNLGVTRISMGVQSFQEKTLRQLGRKQTCEQVYRAYEWIRSVGFDNVNLDLIFPPDFSSLDSWEADLKVALQLAPEHISTYCLTYENERGPFTSGAYKKVDIEKEAMFYEYTWDFLQANGYLHYEVSNFAKAGFECLHNLNTWKMQEWIGWGPSAASQYKNRRFQNKLSLESWQINNYIETVELSEIDLFKDCLVFGLRMTQGIQLDTLKKRFPQIDVHGYDTLWASFQENGWVLFDGNCVRCTPEGMLLADSLALEIL